MNIGVAVQFEYSDNTILYSRMYLPKSHANLILDLLYVPVKTSYHENPNFSNAIISCPVLPPADMFNKEEYHNTNINAIQLFYDWLMEVKDTTEDYFVYNMIIKNFDDWMVNFLLDADE